MKTGLVPLVAVFVLFAAGPSLDADDGPKPDIPGYLMPDSSCPVAAYALWSPCPPSAPFAYVQFPDGKNVARWVGRLVSVRGEIDLTSPCPLPLIKATRVGDNPILPPCPPPACENPPCP